MVKKCKRSGIWVWGTNSKLQWKVPWIFHRRYRRLEEIWRDLKSSKHVLRHVLSEWIFGVLWLPWIAWQKFQVLQPRWIHWISWEVQVWNVPRKGSIQKGGPCLRQFEWNVGMFQAKRETKELQNMVLFSFGWSAEFWWFTHSSVEPCNKAPNQGGRSWMVGVLSLDLKGWMVKLSRRLIASESYERMSRDVWLPHVLHKHRDTCGLWGAANKRQASRRWRLVGCWDLPEPRLLPECQIQHLSTSVPQCTRPARELHRGLGLHQPRCSLIELELMVLMDDSLGRCRSSAHRVEFDAHSVYLSIYLPIYLSTYPSIHLSIYLSNVCMQCNAMQWNGMEWNVCMYVPTYLPVCLSVSTTN